MYFKIYKSEKAVAADRRETWADDPEQGIRIGLVHDNWNDYGFRTTFTVFYVKERGKLEKLGRIKIGRFGLLKENSTPDIPPKFTNLGEEFFSIGQDEEYYS